MDGTEPAMGMAKPTAETDPSEFEHTGKTKVAAKGTKTSRNRTKPAVDDIVTKPAVDDVTKPLVDVDRGYPWVILATSICLMVIGGGFTYSMGVFNLIFLDQFNESKATVAGIGSLSMGLQYFTGPLASVLISWFGWRAAVIFGCMLSGLGVFLGSWATNINHLYWTFGLMAGCGQGLTYISHQIAVGHYFKRHVVLAYGLSAVGAAAGSLAFPPLIQQLLVWLSWREVLMVVACILLQGCVCGALMRPLKPQPLEISTKVVGDVTEMETLIGGNKESRDYPHPTDADEPPVEILTAKSKTESFFQSIKTISNPGFMFYCCSIFVSSIGISAMYVHLSAFTVTQGATRQEASLYLSVIGSASLLGRICTGLAGNDPSVDVLTLYIGSLGLLGLCTTIFPLVAQFYWTRMVYAALFGVYSGANATVYAPVTIQLEGVERLTMAYGVIMLMCGAGYMAGPPVAGGLFDLTGYYDVSFYVSGTCLLVSALCSMLIPVATFTRQSHCADDVTKVKDADVEAVHVTEPMLNNS